MWLIQAIVNKFWHETPKLQKYLPARRRIEYNIKKNKTIAQTKLNLPLDSGRSQVYNRTICEQWQFPTSRISLGNHTYKKKTTQKIHVFSQAHRVEHVVLFYRCQYWSTVWCCLGACFIFLLFFFLTVRMRFAHLPLMLINAIVKKSVSKSHRFCFEFDCRLVTWCCVLHGNSIKPRLGEMIDSICYANGSESRARIHLIRALA